MIHWVISSKLRNYSITWCSLWRVVWCACRSWSAYRSSSWHS